MLREQACKTDKLVAAEGRSYFSHFGLEPVTCSQEKRAKMFSFDWKTRPDIWWGIQVASIKLLNALWVRNREEMRKELKVLCTKSCRTEWGQYSQGSWTWPKTIGKARGAIAGQHLSVPTSAPLVWQKEGKGRRETTKIHTDIILQLLFIMWPPVFSWSYGRGRT